MGEGVEMDIAKIHRIVEHQGHKIDRIADIVYGGHIRAPKQREAELALAALARSWGKLADAVELPRIFDDAGG